MDIDDLIADPPRVHEFQNAPGGTWGAGTDLLAFLRDHLRPGDVTVETGCGLSTAVFAASGTKHTSVFLHPVEGEVFREWAESRGVDLSTVTLLAGGSDRVLPTLDMPLLDMVLIDGGHGFPLPILDWYYTCARLKLGGIVVVDDTHLAPVQRLTEYLDHDPRWDAISPAHITNWRAFRRLTDVPLTEEWPSQAFLPPVRAGDVRRVDRARSVLRPVRRLAATAKHRLRKA